MSMTLEEALAKIDTLSKTNEDLVSRVGTLEIANTDLIQERKDLKDKLKAGSNDEQLKAELDNYKSKLDEVTKANDTLKADYDKDLNSLRMTGMLKDMGIETHNTDALNSVAELALSEATYQDGAFVYLNEDGTTRFNEANNAYSVLDKVNELKEGDKSYLFKQPKGGGAGDKPATPDAKPDINDIINRGLKY